MSTLKTALRKAATGRAHVTDLGPRPYWLTLAEHGLIAVCADGGVILTETGRARLNT